MHLKKCLKSKKSQAVVEYILLFTIVSLGVLIAFGGWDPERLGFVNIMNQAVDCALDQITK